MSKFQKGVITLSIDDGRKDAYALVNEVLNVYKIPATFNITTAFIGGGNSLSLEQLKEIHNNPLFEIAAHGHNHKNFDEDITTGRKLLYDWLNITEDSIGFASPGSGMEEDFICENSSHLRDLGFLYVRTGFSQCERNADTHKRLSGYEGAGINEIYYDFPNMCINSVPILTGRTVESLNKMVDLAASEKACLTLMFHSVRKKGEYNPEDLWTYDYDKFVEFIKYLAAKRDSGEIEIMTTKAAYLKGKRF